MGLGDLMKNFQAAASCLKDENFRKLLAHPKFQALLKDPEFREAVQSKNYLKLMSHPELRSLGEDAELRELMLKVDPRQLGL